MAERGSSSWVIWGAIVADAGVAAAKFTAAGFTGSSAMLAEGIHSTIDTANSALLLLGEHRSKRPADREHPLGHGREIYFWSLIVGIVIFGLGAGMGIYEGVTHLLHPEPIKSAAWNYGVLGLSAILSSASLWISGREFLRQMRPEENLWQAYRRSKDASVYTVVFEDIAAILGLVLALLGVLLGSLLDNPYCDGIASVAIGVMMGVVAVLLVNESRKLLLGESADQQAVDDMQRIAQRDSDVQRVDRPLTMQLGPREVLLLLDVEFRDELTVGELENAIDRMERAIRSTHPEVVRIYVEANALAKRGGGQSLAGS